MNPVQYGISKTGNRVTVRVITVEYTGIHLYTLCLGHEDSLSDRDVGVK